MDISILLTTYNRTQDCIQCLNKLLDQKRIGIEIILLDDYHISDPILSTYCFNNGIKYIHTGAQKEGKVHWRVPGFAYNIGAKLAKGDFLIIGGAEMWHLTKDCIERMYDMKKITYPRVYDEPKKPNGDYRNYKRLNAKLPFCMGVSAAAYNYIGGYDEDFTGYCFDDNDFSDRITHILPLKEIAADVIHLWNPRGSENRGDPRINARAWKYNQEIYLSKEGSVIRNIDKEWGRL